ncbi:MAG: 23S rRNA methyltransferase [Chloroflexi bacterium RBG_13_56_8]|nr:MAG: 23S rRNA methyltransferase [Chloroflexi bacterium RBG_13_56_8]
MPVVQLKPGREKPVQNRHPWVFSGAIADVRGAPQPGNTVDIHSHQGEYLARGYYNPRSQIVVRILSWEEEEIDAAFWRQRLTRAIARRESLSQDEATTAYRLVYAESDGLPGLIVDRYGDWLILQSLTLGIEKWKSTLATLLGELLEPRGILERSDVEVRAHEGLPPTSGTLEGESPGEEMLILENGLRFQVDLREGQKTGFYLDQRENRKKVAAYCSGRQVLDVFSYTGAFGVYALARGAKQVTYVETSAEALRLAQKNHALNQVGEEQEFLEGDAFHVLRQFRDTGRQFDLIILDPPKFAVSRGHVPAATRGYKDLNLLGMKLLRPAGILCTFSCSGLVSEDLFQKVLFGASVDAEREVRIIERLGQGSDHPTLLTFPESTYLKGFVCRVE